MVRNRAVSAWQKCQCFGENALSSVGRWSSGGRRRSVAGLTCAEVDRTSALLKSVQERCKNPLVKTSGPVVLEIRRVPRRIRDQTEVAMLLADRTAVHELLAV